LCNRSNSALCIAPSPLRWTCNLDALLTAVPLLAHACLTRYVEAIRTIEPRPDTITAEEHQSVLGGLEYARIVRWSDADPIAALEGKKFGLLPIFVPSYDGGIGHYLCALIMRTTDEQFTTKPFTVMVINTADYRVQGIACHERVDSADMSDGSKMDMCLPFCFGMSDEELRSYVRATECSALNELGSTSAAYHTVYHRCQFEIFSGKTPYAMQENDNCAVASLRAALFVGSGAEHRRWRFVTARLLEFTAGHAEQRMKIADLSENAEDIIYNALDRIMKNADILRWRMTVGSDETINRYTCLGSYPPRRCSRGIIHHGPPPWMSMMRRVLTLERELLSLALGTPEHNALSDTLSAARDAADEEYYRDIFF
jgi:hypothetical protein